MTTTWVLRAAYLVVMLAQVFGKRSGQSLLLSMLTRRQRGWIVGGRFPIGTVLKAAMDNALVRRTDQKTPELKPKMRCDVNTCV